MQEATNQFLVEGTKTPDRDRSRDDYVICVNPTIKRRLHLGRFAVVVMTWMAEGFELTAEW